MNTTSLIDFPAVDGRPVTQGHTNLCADRGHATHTVGGVDTGVCPRCGEVSDRRAYATARKIQVLEARYADPRAYNVSFAEYSRLPRQIRNLKTA